MSSPADRSRARKRRFRQRQKLGAVVLHVVVDEHKFAEALIHAGMSEQDALCRNAVEQAAASIICEWSERWNASR